MILSKSKIYEMKLINLDLSDTEFIYYFTTLHYPENVLKHMIDQNYRKMMSYVISVGAPLYNASSFAIKTDNSELLSFFTKFSEITWLIAIIIACSGGHKKCIDYILSASKGKRDWESFHLKSLSLVRHKNIKRYLGIKYKIE